MDKVLIDTDVLLDFFFDRKPFSEQAAVVIQLCQTGEIQGFVTPVIVANMYYLLRKTAKHEIVIDKLNQLFNFIQIVPMDKDVVIQALNSRFKDFEDALQNFAAIKHKEIATILTRNLKDYKHSDLAIFTPETYVKGRTA